METKSSVVNLATASFINWGQGPLFGWGNDRQSKVLPLYPADPSRGRWRTVSFSQPLPW